MLLRLGEPEAALDLIAGAGGAPEIWYAHRAMAHHALGETGNFERSIASLVETEQWSDLAQVYVFIGDADSAFEALDRAIEHGQGRQLKHNLFLPQWDNIRDDPRWATVRERLGMSEEQVSILDFSPVLQYER
jgi:FimV-like protein